VGLRDGPSLTASFFFGFIFIVLLCLLRGLPPIIVLSLLRLIASGAVFPLAVPALLSGLALAGLVLLGLLTPASLFPGLVGLSFTLAALLLFGVALAGLVLLGLLTPVGLVPDLVRV
jgi:hypothetical protein